MTINILFCLILASATLNFNTLAFECDYHSNGIETFDNNKVSSYGCEIFQVLPTNSITGNHIAGKRDSDVTFLYRYFGQNEVIDLGPEICRKFPNLKIIFIRLERIGRLDALTNCRNLEELQLFENGITSIDKILQGNVNLRIIAIESNKLTSIAFSIFDNQTKLEKLSLHNNQISSLPSNIFRELVNLKLLSLSNNQLQLINPSWFSSLQRLEKLSLNKNEISIVPEIIFESLPSLRELYLTGNKIQAINPNWFFNTPKLEILGLDRNQITQIKTNDLKTAQNLKGLYLNFNKIEELGQGCFDNLRNLETLGLGWNEIADLPRNIFSALQKLKHLGLNNNQLATVHGDYFGALQSLSSVYLGNNKISSMDQKFLDNTGVTKLDMEQNVCYNGWIFDRTKMKTNLRKCFESYRPRAGQEYVTQSFITTARTPGYGSIEPLQQSSCGRPLSSVGNIIGGSKVKRGDFPWIAALIDTAGSYFCGGTLLSNRKVLTAAHCIQEKQSTTRLYPRDLKVLLGSYDLNAKYELGTKAVAVWEIRVHPDWNPQTEQYHSDIAALVLAERIEFTSYIQPLCFTIDNSIAAINEGIVVGYGKSEDESKKNENIAKVINLPIHKNEDCFLDFPDLVKISSKKTFCAGSARGTGVCLGDSGGGLVVKYRNVYFLRGIVSSSLRDYKFGCDVNTYSVFTDALKFYDWINSIDGAADYYYVSRVDVESLFGLDGAL